MAVSFTAPFGRVFKGSLDDSLVFDTEANLDTYITNNTVCYPGQIVSVTATDKVYLITGTDLPYSKQEVGVGTVTNVTASGPAISSSGGTVPNIVHTTTTGYKHIPSGGASEQALVYSGASGTAIWSTLNNANITNGASYTTNVGTVTGVTASGPALTVTGTTVPNIVHTTTAGYKHIPTGGSTNQALTYNAASGVAKWETLNNTNITNGASYIDERTWAQVYSDSGNTKIPQGYLPAIALTDVYVAGSTSAQLALTVQEGDVCVRTDTIKSYIALNADNVDLGDWQELLNPSGTVTTVTASGPAITSSGGTAPNITHVATAGYKHIPSGGAA